MTSPAAEPVAATPVKQAAFWEDFMDIFYAPAEVFRRRENSGPWPVILTIAALLLVVGFATYNTLAPAMEATVRAAVAKNPQATEATINTALKFSSWTARLVPIFYPLMCLIGAVVVWLLSKIVSANLSFEKALVVVAYASIIDVAKAIITAIFAMVIGPDALTSVYKLSLGASQFVDAATASPIVLAIATRLDVFTIWYTALLGVGVYVIGKVSKGSAIAFVLIHFIVVTLFALIGPAFQSAQAK